MKALLISLFGVYEPVMTDVYAYDGTLAGTAVAGGIAGVDWLWVSGVLLFGVVLYCLLRMIGGLLHD